MEAKEAAFENRRRARRGEDPGTRKSQKAVTTFAEALDGVIALHEPTWKDGGRTAASWRTTMERYVLSKIGKKPVAAITTADVLAIVGPIWTRKHEMARKVKRRLGAVLTWAVTQGYRADNPVHAITAALPKADHLKGHYKAIPCHAPLRLSPQDQPVSLEKLVGPCRQTAVSLRGATTVPHHSPFSADPALFSPRVSPILPL